MGSLQPHHRLLINGAGGRVGSLAVQLAKHRGVTNTVGVDDASKLDFMRELGFARSIDYRTVDFTRMGEQFDVVIDARSTRAARTYARSLVPGGRYVTVGGKTGSLLSLAIWGKAIRRRTGKRLSLVFLKANADAEPVVELYSSGVLRPHIDSVWPLVETAAAMARVSRAEHCGKVVVEVS